MLSEQAVSTTTLGPKRLKNQLILFAKAEGAILVAAVDNTRQNSAHRYLHPRIQQEIFPDLHVLGRKVEGVECRPNLQISGTAATPSLAESIKARRFVIVSAGAVRTPLLLERSGIGSGDVLEKAGVPCCLFTYNSTTHPADTFKSIYNGTRSIPAVPTSDDKVIPSRPLASMILINGILADPAAFPKGEYFTICSYVPYPYSRGHVHITGPEIGQAPDFKSGFLADQDSVDLEIYIWAYKKQREIARRIKTMRSEIPDQHPPFLQNVIEYSDEDNEAIKRFIRGKVATTWHPLGTCRMAPLKEGGVVDERLNMHGIESLKMADMSIAPRNVSGNTMSTALIVGERLQPFSLRISGSSAVIHDHARVGGNLAS
ncbi:GMC oxidoreductase [Xylaria curta]|nr:GMC oxidoreductase [Xylaria curta]